VKQTDRQDIQNVRENITFLEEVINKQDTIKTTVILMITKHLV